MADFATWGCAIAEAMGYEPEFFLNAYYENIAHQNEQVLGESVLVSILRNLIHEEQEWEGTASDLLKQLRTIALNKNIDVDRDKTWPKAANTLSRQLNNFRTNLANDGIKLETGVDNKERFIRITKTNESIVGIATSSLDIDSQDEIRNYSNDEYDGFPTISGF